MIISLIACRIIIIIIEIICSRSFCFWCLRGVWNLYHFLSSWILVNVLEDFDELFRVDFVHNHVYVFQELMVNP